MLSIRPAAVAELCTRGTRERWKRRCRPAWAAHPARRAAPSCWSCRTPATSTRARWPAQAYALLAPWRAQIRRVVLLGPTHRVACAAWRVPTVDAFETPLGRVATRRAALARTGRPAAGGEAATARTRRSIRWRCNCRSCRPCSASFTLLPLAVGDASADEVAEVLERLWGGDETLIVISTDLSHYLPYDARRAHGPRDRRRASCAWRRDLDHDQACGATPLNGALAAARRTACRPRLLDLRNSGDTAGDRRRVVGYAALASRAALEEAVDARRRGAVECRRRHARRGAAQPRPQRIADRWAGLPSAEPAHPALLTPGRHLRHAAHAAATCAAASAGSRPSAPLDDDVRRNAARRGLRDPRFEPLAGPGVAGPARSRCRCWRRPSRCRRAHEPRPCADAAPGVDGVILEWRGRRATFLPQVWEQLPRRRASSSPR